MPLTSNSTQKKKCQTQRIPVEVSRRIKPDVTAMLWGRAAGRCEFLGCNLPLWKSLATQESVNCAQRAHIYSFSDDGPRGNAGIDKQNLNDSENLLLVCYGCHKTIDKYKNGGRYSVDLLKQWKTAHEHRIEIVTGIDSAKKSHVLLYGANIDQHSSPLNFADAASALFPFMHPAESRAIQLGMINSDFTDRSPEFWTVESQNLQNKYDRRLRERLSEGEIEHLSVFALAPQPLLILLGSLMTDIIKANIFQLHREPQTWCWPDQANNIVYEILEPENKVGPPALVVELSATVTSNRIHGVLGENASIWRVTVSEPHNDLIKSHRHLAEFRTVVRRVLNKIKEFHGQQTVLHVFPAMGVATAIELGRVRMPKAEMPWQLYDQVNARGGFIPALLLSPGAES